MDDSATAHDGSLTAVAPTPEGMSWVTAGTDSRVRLWDSARFRCEPAADSWAA